MSFSNLKSFRKHLKSHENIEVSSCSSNTENVFVKNHGEIFINDEHNENFKIDNKIQCETIELESDYDELPKLLVTLKTTYYWRLYCNTTFSRKDVQNIINNTKYLMRNHFNLSMIACFILLINIILLQLMYRKVSHVQLCIEYFSGH